MMNAQKKGEEEELKGKVFRRLDTLEMDRETRYWKVPYEAFPPPPHHGADSGTAPQLLKFSP